MCKASIVIDTLESFNLMDHQSVENYSSLAAMSAATIGAISYNYFMKRSDEGRNFRSLSEVSSER